jgi:tRNA-specific 2-thiouridylase
MARRVVVAMSGGVDSSVAAALLVRAGHEVIGLFMRHSGEPESTCATGSVSATSLPIVTAQPSHKQGCCSASDAHDARRVADRLGVPFYALDFQDQFGQIVDYFVREYTSGRTPNPCVMCNNWLKFGHLLRYADSVGADAIATGHYARLRPAATPSDSPALLRGRDAAKDQSYVLFGLDRRELGRVLFPVGDYTKDAIRELARELGLRVADKPDSQEICFVPDGDYAALVRRRGGQEDRSGELVTTAGDVLGRHDGIENFTIGQRRGLGVAVGERRYVVRIEPKTRRVVIGERHELARTAVLARDANWLIDPPAGPLRCQVKIRYQARPVAATVTQHNDGTLHAELDEPQYGVAPGQALVCYEGDRVLGGGWIE